MAITVKELTKDFDLWDRFVEGSPQSSIFSTSKWKQLVEESTGYKGHILAFFRANEIIAGILYFSIKKGPFRLVYQPPLTPFTTLLFEKEKTNKFSKTEAFEKEVVEMLDKNLRHYSYVFLLMHPVLKDIRPFNFQGWYPRVNYTYYTDLSDIEKLWQELEKSAKYEIRRAEEKGVKVTASDDVDTFYDLYKKTLETKGLKLASKKLIYKITKLENAKIYNTTKDKQAIASAVVIFDKGSAYYLLAASDPEFRDYKAPSLLLWEIMKDCSKKVSKIDLVGANTPAVLKFKRVFATNLIPYYSVEKFNSGLAKLALSFYRKTT